MLGSIVKIDLEDPVEAIPAYLTIIFMPMAYSISEGLAIGIISYVILHALTGRRREITPLMYILCILFILKYVLL